MTPRPADTRLLELKRIFSVQTLLLLLWLLLPSLLLTACGPGTGGTGTGPPGAVIFAPLSFSSPKATPASSMPPVLGVASAVADPCLVDCAGESGILRIEAEQVQLQTRCAQFVSLSALVVAATGETVLAGTLETQRNFNGTIQTSSLAALLIAEFSSGKPDSDRVVLRVVDTKGALLVSPLALQRDTAVLAPPSSAVPASCP